MSDRDPKERFARLETEVHQHDADLVGMHDWKHKTANVIEGFRSRIAVVEVQLKAHDRVIWAFLYAVIGSLAGMVAWFINQDWVRRP